MSRIRSIHPGFFSDEDLVSVTLGARLLFIGIGIEADDKGVFEWKPLTIKMRVFPADNIDVAAALDELEGIGAIRRYSHGGKLYGAIKNFRKFQRPKTPNDIHPISPELRIYVGLDPAISEPFPPKGEKPPQMEEGGDKREEESAAAAHERECANAGQDDDIAGKIDLNQFAGECARTGGVDLISPGHIAAAVDLVKSWLALGVDRQFILDQIEGGVAATAEQQITSLKFYNRRIQTAAAKRKALENGTPAKPEQPDTLASILAGRIAARRAAESAAGAERPLALPGR